MFNKCAQNIKHQRAAVDREILNEYFDELQKTLDGVPASHVLNYDETNSTNDPGVEKVAGKWGSRYTQAIKDHSKSSISVMFCGSAANHLLQPSGSCYNHTDLGWFNMCVFERWFRDIVLPYVSKLIGLEVLIGENLSSHVSP